MKGLKIKTLIKPWLRLTPQGLGREEIETVSKSGSEPRQQLGLELGMQDSPGEPQDTIVGLVTHQVEVNPKLVKGEPGKGREEWGRGQGGRALPFTILQL